MKDGQVELAAWDALLIYEELASMKAGQDTSALKAMRRSLCAALGGKPPEVATPAHPTKQPNDLEIIEKFMREHEKSARDLVARKALPGSVDSAWTFLAMKAPLTIRSGRSDTAVGLRLYNAAHRMFSGDAR